MAGQGYRRFLSLQQTRTACCAQSRYETLFTSIREGVRIILATRRETDVERGHDTRFMSTMTRQLRTSTSIYSFGIACLAAATLSKYATVPDAHAAATIAYVGVVPDQTDFDHLKIGQ